MSTFTPEELKAIVQAPMLVGLTVAMVDMGIVSTAIEATAMSKEIAGAAQKYPNNSIIQAAFSESGLKSGDMKLDKPDIKPEEVKSGAVLDRIIATVNATLQSLEGKAPEADIQQYKQFIYDCGEAVAQAAGSGLFGSGAKVSEKEAAALTKLKAALELD